MLFRLLILLFFTSAIFTTTSQLIHKKLRKPPNIQTRIVGGTQVDIREIPYQVSIQLLISGHTCGGSLISKRYVLTAAHCSQAFFGIRYFYWVRIGSSAHNFGGILAHVSKIIKHPLYNGFISADYDFAIFELYNWNEHNVIHGYVQLPKENEKVPDGELLQVSGWGFTSLSITLPKLLQVVTVQKINQAVCRNDYKSFFLKVTDRMLCAGSVNGGKDACKGDSGGPLISKKDNKLVGVVSWGKGCAQAKFPGVYSQVSSVRKWIKDTTGV